MILAGEAELARVKSEWPDAARRLDRQFAQVRGTARMWRDDSLSSKKTPLSEVRFAIDHGMEKVDIARFNRAPMPIKLADIVYSVGQGTAFHLNRGAVDQIYKVMGIGKTPKERQLYESVFGEYVHAHHGVMGRPMSEVLDSPGFKIEAAEVVDRDGRQLMKVDCAIGQGPTAELISVDLDTEAGWTFKSCRIRPSYDNAMLFRYEVEYGPPIDGVPVPREVRTDGSTGTIDHCVFGEWRFASTALSEFNMAHYGLPDLIHPARPRNTFAAWLVVASVIAGLIAFAIRRLVARGPRRIHA